MSIGVFARPNSNTPVAKFYGGFARVRHEASRTASALVATCRATIQAVEIRRLFLAEAVNETHGAAVISLAGAAIAAGINLAELGMFVVELDQANRPALREFHVEAATGHPSSRPAPMTELIEAALGLQVVTGITGSDQKLAKGSDLVQVAQRIDARAQQQGIELRVSVYTVVVIGFLKIASRAQPAEDAIVRVQRKSVHVQPVAIGLQQRSIQISAAQFEIRPGRFLQMRLRDMRLRNTE